SALASAGDCRRCSTAGELGSATLTRGAINRSTTTRPVTVFIAASVLCRLGRQRCEGVRRPRMFFELRQYHIHPGQQKAWVKCMEEEIIPFQVKMGMVILGSFDGEEEESVYGW